MRATAVKQLRVVELYHAANKDTTLPCRFETLYDQAMPFALNDALEEPMQLGRHSETP